jgi:hypothetical protein
MMPQMMMEMMPHFLEMLLPKLPPLLAHVLSCRAGA